MKNRAAFPALIVGIALSITLLLCGLVVSSPHTSQAAGFVPRTQGGEKSSGAACLDKDKPKPEVMFRFDILNGKTMEMPRPAFPTAAKRKGISGEVKTEVVLDLNTGIVEWARILNGHPLLQEAVSKVVCQARFFPTNDIDGRASGYLIYRFRSRRQSK